MSLGRLALRNLLRAPRRTVLTAVAIVAGVGLFIVGSGFLAGVTENVVRSAIDGTVGHVLVRPAGYPTQPGQHPVDELLEVPPAARALVDREARAWTERTLLAPLAAAGRDSVRVTAVGYHPERDRQVFPRTHWRVEGELPAAGDRVAVSHRVARLLHLERGSRLVLQVRTHQGAINALEVEVAALVSTGNIALDRLGIFLPQELVRRLIAAQAPTHLAIKLGDRADAEPFAARLRAALGAGAEVVTWRQETAELVRLQEIRKRALNLVMFILMALAASGIANTILMAAHERVREIGTLRAMGMSEGGVLRLFLLEGALIGLLGSLLGGLWGGLLVGHWSRNPLDFSAMFEKGVGAVAMSALVYAHLDLAVAGGTMLVGLVVSVLASIYPARLAARLSPAEAVRAP